MRDDKVKQIVESLSVESVRIVAGPRTTSERTNGSRRVRDARDLLSESFSVVPLQALKALEWSDSLPVFAVPNVGIVLNPSRLGRLALRVDSAWYYSTEPLLRDYISERPGVRAIALVLMHERSHLALNRHSIATELSSAMQECTADYIAGFFVDVLTRANSSSRSDLGLGAGGLGALVGNAVEPGDWLSRGTHPDEAQRAACVEAGIQASSRISGDSVTVSNRLLVSKVDSVHDALASGTMSLIDGAIAQSSLILSARLDDAEPRKVQVWPRKPSREAVALVDALVSVLSDSNWVASATARSGARISTGVAQFPTSFVYEFAADPGVPWRCGVLPSNEDQQRAIACYLFVSDMEAFYLRDEIRTDLSTKLTALRVRKEALGTSLAKSASTGIEQWLLSGSRSQRAVLTIATHGTSREAIGPRSEILWIALRPMPSGL